MGQDIVKYKMSQQKKKINLSFPITEKKADENSSDRDHSFLQKKAQFFECQKTWFYMTNYHSF